MIEIPDIADCKVTASYNNGEVEAKGNVMTIKPSTFSLSFMRYTLAKDDRQKHFTWPQREQTTAYSLNKSVDIANYTVKATSVREGYIYIYFDNKPDLFKEFKIDVTGALTNIISDLQDDVREQKDPLSRKYYCITNKDIVWIAFSEFQWSAAHINDIRTKSELRENRMQKFDATQWAGNQNQVDAFTVDNIDAYFPLEDDDTLPNQLEDGRWTGGLMRDLMNSAKIQWWMSYYNNVKVIEEVPDEREEVFFCLHDVLGCTDELNNELLDQWDNMDATIMAIHSGLSPKDIKGKVLNGSSNIDDLIKDKNKATQIETLVKTATMLYKTSFSNEENIEKYGEGLDKDRIEALLALNQRREIRDEIKSARIVLTDFLQTDYYKSYSFCTETESDDNIQYIQRRYYAYTESLANPPHVLDSFLNLQEENAEYGDNIEFKGKLQELIHIDELQTPSVMDITDELSGLAKDSRLGIIAFMGMIDGMGDIASMNPEQLSKIEDNLNAIKTYVGGTKIDQVFKIKKVKISETPKLLIFADKVNPAYIPFASARYAGSYNNLILSGADIEVPQLTFSDKFLNAIRNNKAFFDGLNKLKAKLPWDALMRKMAILNVAICTKEVFSATKNKSNVSAAYLGLLAGSIGVIEQVVKKRGVKALALAETQLAKETAEALIRKAKIFGGVGTILCGVSDIIASVGEFKEKDNDAGLLLIGAGVSSIVSGVSTLMMFDAIASIAIIANPITGTIAFVGIIGFTIWAIYAQDDPLERLIVNCLFDKGIVSGWENFFGYEVSKVINSINNAPNISKRSELYYDNRAILAKEGFEKWENYIDLYTETTDLLNATLVKSKKKNLIPGRISKNRIVPAYNFYPSIEAEIICGQYYVDLSKVDLHVELYLTGDYSSRSNEQIEIVSLPPTVHSICPFSYVLKINIDKKYAPTQYAGYKYAKAFVLLYYRIDTFGNQQQWNPIKDYKNDEARYVASQIPLCLHSTHIDDRDEVYRFIGKTKTGTLKQIKDMAFWEDNYILNIHE